MTQLSGKAILTGIAGAVLGGSVLLVLSLVGDLLWFSGKDAMVPLLYVPVALVIGGAVGLLIGAVRFPKN